MKVVHITEIYNDESPIGYFINYDLLTPEHKEIIDQEIAIQSRSDDMTQVFEIYEDGFNGEGWEYCIVDIKGKEVTVLDELEIYER